MPGSWINFPHIPDMFFGKNFPLTFLQALSMTLTQLLCSALLLNLHFYILFNQILGSLLIFFLSSSVISYSPKESSSPLISWSTCCGLPDPSAPYGGLAASSHRALNVTSSACCSLGQLSVSSYTWHSLLSPWSGASSTPGIKVLIFTFLLEICDLIICFHCCQKFIFWDTDDISEYRVLPILQILWGIQNNFETSAEAWVLSSFSLTCDPLSRMGKPLLLEV